MQTYLAVINARDQGVEIAIVAKDYWEDSDGTKTDEAIGQIFISRVDGDQLFIQVAREDESWVGPVTVKLP